jgi:hypothetical protein
MVIRKSSIVHFVYKFGRDLIYFLNEVYLETIK